MINKFNMLKVYEGIDEKLFFKRHISKTRGHSRKMYMDRGNMNVKNSVLKMVVRE